MSDCEICRAETDMLFLIESLLKSSGYSLCRNTMATIDRELRKPNVSESF
jgi:hypothetical protein